MARPVVVAPLHSNNHRPGSTSFAIGKENFRKGEYALAVTAFENAITQGYRDFELYVKLVLAQGRAGWYISALEKAKEACVKFKDEKGIWTVWYARADVLFCQGQADARLSQSHYALAKKSIRTALKYTERLKRGQVRMDAADKIGRLSGKIDAAGRAQLAREQASMDEQTRKAAEASRAANVDKRNHIQHLHTDILVLIAEHVQRDKPERHIIMARVCQKWRNTILEQPRLWKILTLGGRGPMAKARHWVKYSRGRIREITFTDDFDPRLQKTVEDVLEDSVGHVKQLTMVEPTVPRGSPSSWIRQFRSLERLVYDAKTTYQTDPPLDFIRNGSPALCHLDVRHLQPSLHDPRNGPAHYSAFQRCIAEVKTLHISQSVIHLFGFEDRFADSPRAALLQLMTEAEEVTFDRLAWSIHPAANAGAQAIAQPIPGQRPRRIVLPNLKSYDDPSADYTTNQPVFNLVYAPNLQRLALWDLRGAWDSRVLDHLGAPGLTSALPDLVALDIGKSAFDQVDLLRVLKKLRSLRFLNVSFCGLDNTFLDAIQLKDNIPDAEQILPHLSALSVAGHEGITTAAVRDFLNSRLSATEKIPVRVEKPPMKGPSMFKPTAPKVDKGKGREVTRSTQNTQGSQRAPLQSLSTQSSRSIPESTQPMSTYPISQPITNLPVNPRIDWLNIDHCDNIEAAAVDRWRPKIRFISHQPLGQPDYDRIRGKGKWNWDAEWTDDCGRGDDMGCYLRKVPGRPDSWEIWHTCHAKAEARIAALATIDGDEKRKPGWARTTKPPATASTLDDA